MIKITIKTNLIDTDQFAFFKSSLHIKTMFVPTVRLFSITLLICEFNPHRQTWYQKFIRTYSPLNDLLKSTPTRSIVQWEDPKKPPWKRGHVLASSSSEGAIPGVVDQIKSLAIFVDYKPFSGSSNTTWNL